MKAPRPMFKYVAPAAFPATYSEDYRHFDTLIWQAQVWTTAVFAAVLGGFGYLRTSADVSHLAPGIDSSQLASILLMGGIGFFAAAYYTLFRWRVHQRYTARMNVPRPLTEWTGAQLFLQFVVGGQGAVLLFLLLAVWEVAPLWVWIVSGASVIVPSIVVETLMHDRKQHAASLSQRSPSPGAAVDATQSAGSL